MKLHVVYDKDGDKVGDIDSFNYAVSKLHRVKGTDQELQVNVANSLVIHCFRLLVRDGRILPYVELFFYNKATDPKLEKPITIDPKGELSNYPEGFIDAYSNILFKLI